MIANIEKKTAGCIGSPKSRCEQEKTAENKSTKTKITKTDSVSLLSFSDEVLQYIAQYLDVPSICVLKRTCCHLANTINLQSIAPLLVTKYYGNQLSLHRCLQSESWNLQAQSALTEYLRSLIIQYDPQFNFNLASLPQMVALIRAISNHKKIENQTPYVKTLETSFKDKDTRMVRAFSNNVLIIQSDDGNLQLLDVTLNNNQDAEKTIFGVTGKHYKFIKLKDNRLIIYTIENNLEVWRVTKFTDPKYEKTLLANIPNIGNITLLTNEYLAFSTGNNEIMVLDLKKPFGTECVKILRGHNNRITGIRSLKDDRLSSFSDDSTIKIWDLTKADGQECVKTIDNAPYWIKGLIVLENGFLVSWNLITVWNLQQPDGKECEKTIELNDKNYFPTGVTELKNKILISWASSIIKVLDWTKPDKEECIKTLIGHTDTITDVIVLADERLASCSYDKTQKIWDLMKPAGQECVNTLIYDNPVYRAIQLKDWRLVLYGASHRIKFLDLYSCSAEVTGSNVTDHSSEESKR